MPSRDTPLPSERTHRADACGTPRRLRVVTSFVTVLVLSGGCSPMYSRASSTDGASAAPVRYDAHRFFLRPVTLAGDTLLLFLDSGGDNILRASVATRAGMKATPQVGARGDTTWVVSLPPFRDGTQVPIPAGSAAPVMQVPGERAMATMAKVWPGTADWSGELGGMWFADGTWTFDYLHGRLSLQPQSLAIAAVAPHIIPLAFKVVDGTRPTNFPRLRAQIDGDSLDLLFDTGATVTLGDSAWRVIGDALPRERATSFMAASVFDRWRRRHPEWRVLERGEFYSGRELIEVPTISIAGFLVGPVWFTRRLDAEFVPYVSAGTDREVIGALGGSAFQYFTITIDYRRGLAEFARAK